MVYYYCCPIKNYWCPVNVFNQLLRAILCIDKPSDSLVVWLSAKKVLLSCGIN